MARFPGRLRVHGKTQFTPMQNPNIPSSQLLFSKAGAPPGLCRCFLPLALLSLLVSLALSPAARAVSPPADGGYPNDNTAEGTGALSLSSQQAAPTRPSAECTPKHHNRQPKHGHRCFCAYWANNASGSDNTANGYRALHAQTTGNNNTANGSGALHSNTTTSGNTANGFKALYNNTTGSLQHGQRP